MNIEAAIKERRSIRNYLPQKISHADFEEIVSLARYSPSWKNSQTIRYTLVEDDGLKQHIADECVMDFTFNANTINKAPNLVILSMVNGICGYERDGSYSTKKEDRWQMFDAGVSAQTFSLVAHAKGYGTVILGIFDEDKIAEAVNLPDGQTVAAVIVIGRPADEPSAPKRKDTADLVSYI